MLLGDRPSVNPSFAAYRLCGCSFSMPLFSLLLNGYDNSSVYFLVVLED